MSRLAEFKPAAFAFPDSLNLFEGEQDNTSTIRTDYGDHGKLILERSRPKDCIEFSKDRVDGSTTIKDAYRPYSGKNYIPTAASRVNTASGEKSKVRTTKAVHILARPKTQMRMSRQKIENMTSYSYQFSGDSTQRSDPFRPKSEMEGPSGDLLMCSTNNDYGKHNYGRPDINRIPDNGLFDKKSYIDGTTSGFHFGTPCSTKEGNLRPKTSVILGNEKFIPRSSYRKQFDKVKEIYAQAV